MNLVSVIIPVRYRPDLTRVCIDSILTYTRQNIEIITVQEGEDQEIFNLLKSYGSRIKYVQNTSPKGFAGAMNIGISIASGDYYCFLNNDTVATPGWLEEMMLVFEDEGVGLVTPTYTEANTRQVVDYNNGQQFDYIDDPTSLKGVCFLVKKQVIDQIGGWDESFGMGGGEDNDLCIRIKQANYKLVIARKSYIYHYGSASFRELFNNDVDYSKKYAVQQFNKVREKYSMQSKPRVFIAIPSADGFIHHELLIRLLEWSHDTQIQLKIKVYPHLFPLDNARNVAVKEFLEEYYDYLLFIDNDIIPPTNSLRVLLEADKEIIAPLCFTTKRDDKGLLFPLPVAHKYDENHEYRPYYGQGIEETDVVTGGMFLVKREVYEKLERPFYFTYHKNGLVEYSEDFVFSQQCQKLGYKLYTHFGLLCKHYKNIDVKDINDLMATYG